MKLSDVLISRSRTRILEILWRQEQPLSVRRISDLANIPVSAISRVLRQLEREKILSSTRDRNSILFQLNCTHPFYEVWRGIFQLVEDFNLKTRATAYKTGAYALQFASEAHELYSKMEKLK